MTKNPLSEGTRQTTMRMNKYLYSKVEKDAKDAKRSITKQVEFIIEQYYKMKDLTESR